MSYAVLEELLATPDAGAREHLSEMARNLDVVSDPEPSELNSLVEMYMRNRAFPRDKRDDAVHVAIMVLNPTLDAMVTWNCRHLANEHNRRYLRTLTLSEGYPFNFQIITPEEALVYEQPS